MTEDGAKDREGRAVEAAGRNDQMARIALIVAAMALALSILGLFLPI